MKLQKTTNERLQELYLEKAMEQYEEAAGQTAMEQYEKDAGQTAMKELENQPEQTADAASYMARVDARRKCRLYCRKVGRRALVLLAVLITCFAFLMGTVSAFRVSVLNLFYSGEFADLGASENQSEFTNLENASLPQYIPPGYTLTDLHIEEKILCATYGKGKTASIHYTAYPPDMEHFLDTEASPAVDAVLVEINAADGLLIRRADAVSLSWWSETCFYELYGRDTPEEELLRIAKSIQMN